MATEHIIDCDTPEDDDPPVTRAEIAEALTTMAASAARIPAHWVDHKRRAHERINAVLDQYEATPDGLHD